MGLFQYASDEPGSGKSKAKEKVFFEANVLASIFG